MPRPPHSRGLDLRSAPEWSEITPDGDKSRESAGGIRQRLSDSRQLVRIAYRDPEHIAERLTLFGSQRLSEPSRKWARRVRREQPEAAIATIAEEVRIHTAQVARIDGAVSGTPFLVALVPGYLAYLWQEGRMEQRIAALYGHDPRGLDTAAQILMLRGVHRTVKEAQTALLKVREAPLPEKPTARRALRVWVRSVYLVMVFGGFLSPSSDEGDRYRHWRLKAAMGTLVATLIWAITWLFPVTFMIAMAWACESHARALGSRTIRFYGGESAVAEASAVAQDKDRGRTKRELLRGLLIVLSVAIPVLFVAYADRVRQTTGINWLGALGALVAASLVLATTVVASRR